MALCEMLEVGTVLLWLKQGDYESKIELKCLLKGVFIYQNKLNQFHRLFL